jgi:hypothetical protein
MVTAVLVAPLGAKVEVRVLSANYREVPLEDWGIDGRIVPALESVEKVEGATAKFVLDEKTYKADAYYPSIQAEAYDNSAEGGLARGHRLVTVRMYPVQYNPARGTVRYATDIRVQVDFAGGDWQRTRLGVEKDYSKTWEEMIQRMAVNYQAAGYKAPPSLPIYYDIFYGQNFSAAAQALAEWKTKKGFKVRMNMAGGWSAAAIRDSIRLRSPVATYVTIISDPNATGTDIVPASATGSSSGDQTDLYYAETNMSGYLPDLYYARISVKTTAEANTAVDKLVRYEKANFGTAGTAWLRKAQLIAGYDGSWQWLGIATGEYCRQILAREGYTTVDTLILGSSEGKARIVSRVNDGRAWTIYTAHGGQNCWCTSPYWYANQLNGDLTNLDMYTMAAGHCCLAGDFQYSEDCFAETWPKLQNKGGVSYYGSVPSTYWYEDDWLQRRYFDAIYDSIPGTPGLKMPEVGRYTQWGLYWIQNNASTTRKQYYFEAYHVFNDASMDFWTNEPDQFQVTHLPNVPPNSGTFAVNVKDNDGSTNLNNALVCAWVKNRTGEHWSAYTDASGNVVLPVMTSTPGDTMYITVTRHNYQPYEGFAMVQSLNGPYVILQRYSLSDASGNNDGIANPGETVRLPLWVINYGTATAQSLTGTLRTASPNGTVTADSVHNYGNIAAGDSAYYAAGFGVYVNPADTNGMTIPLTLECRDANDSAWTSQFSLTVGTGVLAYDSKAIGGNGRLDPGETAGMSIALKNNGLGYSYGTSATLRCSDARITVTDSTADYDTLAPGAVGTSGADSFRLDIGSMPPGTSVGFAIVMKADGAADRLYSWNETVGDLRYSPTPDNYSGSPLYYAVEDSDGVSRAPVYSWTEIRGVGTQLTLGDDVTATATLPFGFRWYGTNYTSLSVCSNGWMSFGSNTSTSYSNTAIPTSTFATPTVFALWDDLNANTSTVPGAWVGYWHDAAGGRFIVEYDSVVFYSTSTRLKFQAIFYDSTASHPYYDVVLQYNMLADRASSSVGFQQNSSVGCQLLQDGAYATTAISPLKSGRAVRITRTPDVTGVAGPSTDSASLIACPLGNPTAFSLGAAYPNPLRGTTTIKFGLPRETKVELGVYNIVGQKVATLASGVRPAGYHTVRWDGRSDAGQKVSGGVYFYRLTTPDYTGTKRLVMLR